MTNLNLLSEYIAISLGYSYRIAIATSPITLEYGKKYLTDGNYYLIEKEI